MKLKSVHIHRHWGDTRQFSCKVDFEGLTDLQEDLLKFVARRMGADLLGGRDVTRLDAMLGVSHPRIRYRQALERKKAQGGHQGHGQASSGTTAKGSSSKAGGKREFRRKSG